MNFFSTDFIFVFLPLFILLHGLTKGRLRNVVLLSGNLLFYYFACRSFFCMGLILIALLMTYVIGLAIDDFQGKTRKLLLSVGVVYHAVILLSFKYASFTAEPLLHAVFTGQNTFEALLFPLGISYYTFKNISYLHEVYRRDIPAETSLLNFAAYLTLFPQIISGPIQTYSSCRAAIKNRSVTPQMMEVGLTEFIFGLALKEILANRLGIVFGTIERIGYESISTPLAWVGILAFSLQLYFDFYGYSLMATGIGCMIGYRTPENFRYPYESRSVSEFWRRWHITLGDWFKDNVYFPLGGSRVSKPLVYRNLLIVWLLTGIWHGNTVTYLFWGLFLFAVIAVEKSGFVNIIIENPVLSHIWLIFFIMVSWTIFKIEDPSDLLIYFSRLFPFFSGTPDYVYRKDVLDVLRISGRYLLFGILFATSLPRSAFSAIRCKKWLTVPLLLLLFWYSVYLSVCSAGDPFLYGNY